MAVAGIANLVEDLANQLFGRSQETRGRTNTREARDAGNGAAKEDTFTPSTQHNSGQATAQDAGLFQVRQVALTEVTANILLAQTTPNTNQNGAPAQAAPVTTTNAGTAQTAAPANSNTTGNAAQQVAAAPVAQAATGAATATTNVQDHIQALNAALAALGLSNAQIQQIDRIASLIQDFDPTAYSDLVSQFKALAQQAAQSSSSNTAANASTAASPSTTASTNANASTNATASTNANGGGFQVQGILINFTTLQETVNNASGNGSSQGSSVNNFRISADSLRIEQVQFTLANGNGQTIQAQAPQQNTNAGTTDRQASQTHVAAA